MFKIKISLKSSLVLNNSSNFFSSPPKECKSPVIFYKRYVDDIFIIFDKKYKEKILNTFNNYNSDIKFTIENEDTTDHSINFLDIKIYRNNNSFASTNWYRKNICCDQ